MRGFRHHRFVGSLINPVICHHSCACLRHHRHRFAACNACNNTCNNACDAGDRTVLAAAGLPHQQLVDLAAPMLESIPPTPAPAAAAAHGLQGAPKLSSSDSRAVEPASRYVGGHAVLPGSAPHANLILAFEYKGGWRDIPVRVCTCMHACIHACTNCVDSQAARKEARQPVCCGCVDVWAGREQGSGELSTNSTAVDWTKQAEV